MELCGASEEVTMRDSVLSVTDAGSKTKWKRALSLPVPIERCVSKGCGGRIVPTRRFGRPPKAIRERFVMDHSLLEPQYPLLSEGKLRMLWRGTLKEHRPREETYSEYMIYVYSNIRISIHLYVEKSDRKGKEDMPIISYPNINISVYIVIRIPNQVTVGDTALPPGQQRPGGFRKYGRNYPTILILR